EELYQDFFTFFHQLAPGLRDAATSLDSTRTVTVFQPSSFKRLPRFDPCTVKILLKSLCSFPGRAFEEVELVDTTVFIRTLLSGKVEAPGFPISQNNERNSSVECVFECLANGVVGFTRLLYLDECRRFRWRMTQGEVSSTFSRL